MEPVEYQQAEQQQFGSVQIQAGQLGLEFLLALVATP